MTLLQWSGYCVPSDCNPVWYLEQSVVHVFWHAGTLWCYNSIPSHGSSDICSKGESGGLWKKWCESNLINRWTMCGFSILISVLSWNYCIHFICCVYAIHSTRHGLLLQVLKLFTFFISLKVFDLKTNVCVSRLKLLCTERAVGYHRQCWNLTLEWFNLSTAHLCVEASVEKSMTRWAAATFNSIPVKWIRWSVFWFEQLFWQFITIHFLMVSHSERSVCSCTVTSLALNCQFWNEILWAHNPLLTHYVWRVIPKH